MCTCYSNVDGQQTDVGLMYYIFVLPIQTVTEKLKEIPKGLQPPPLSLANVYTLSLDLNGF